MEVFQEIHETPGVITLIPVVKLEQESANSTENVRRENATLQDASTNIDAISQIFLQYLASIDIALLEYVPDDLLECLAKSLQMLRSRGVANIIYLLSKALASSTNSAEGFGTDTLAFKALQLMLVSMFYGKENQSELLASSDPLIPFLFEGLAVNEGFVDHINKVLFPGNNFYYVAEGIQKKRIFLVQLDDMAVQCQYQQSSISSQDLHDDVAGKEHYSPAVADMDESSVSDTTEVSTATTQQTKNIDSFTMITSNNISEPSSNQVKQDAILSPCPECDLKFISEEDKADHEKKKKCQTCGDCNKVFDSRKLWVEHQVVRHGKSRFICYVCNKDIGMRNKLVRHSREVHGVVNKLVFEKNINASVPFSCYLCIESFDKAGKLECHLRDVHRVGLKEVKDEVKEEEMKANETPDTCDDVPADESIVIKQEEIEQLEENEQSDNTPTQTSRRKNRKLKVECTVCGKMVANVWEHMAVHDRAPRFKCEECGECFLHRVSYKRHMVRHKGLTFPCPVCSKAYGLLEYLKAHVRVQHAEMTVDLPEFATPSSKLMKHMRLKPKMPKKRKISEKDNTGIALELDELRDGMDDDDNDDGREDEEVGMMDIEELYEKNELEDYFCDICGKGFCSHYNVRRHKKMMHSSETDTGKKNKTNTSKITSTASDTSNTEKSSQASEALKKNDVQPASTSSGSAETAENCVAKTANTTTICSECTYTPASEELLRKHEESQICKTCGVCNVTFGSRKELLRHKKAKHVVTPTTCGLCTKIFINRLVLFKHFKTMNCISCFVCNESFASVEETQQHKLSHVARGLTTCTFCQRVFTTVWKLTHHMKEKHGINDTAKVHSRRKTFQCDLCDRNYPYRDMLIKHKRSEHPQQQQTGYLCTECGLSLRSESKLNDHMNMHSGETPYSCTQCDASYASAKSLRMHISRHSEELCEFCGDAFQGKILLHRHLKLAHAEQKGISLLGCLQCNKKFGWQNELKRHVELVHEGLRKYTCDICGKTFKQNQHLASHMGTHDKIPRFKCETCGEGFVHRASYKRHLVQHLGRKAFVCPVCTNKFDTMEYLKRHIRCSHKGMKVELPEFSNPGSTMLNDMKVRKRGGRKPNSKLVTLPKMEAASTSHSGGVVGDGGEAGLGETQDGYTSVIYVPENVKKGGRKPNSKQGTLPKTEPTGTSSKGAAPLVGDGGNNFIISSLADGGETGMRLVEMQDGDGETNIIYVPENVNFIQIGDSVLQFTHS